MLTALLMLTMTLLFVSCNKDDDYSAPESYDGVAVQLQRHTKGNGVPIIIMCDGYTEADIKSGLYHRAAMKAYSHLFDISPMDSLKDYFDVVEVQAVSTDTLIDTKSGNTAFKSRYSDENGNSAMWADSSVVARYAAKVGYNWTSQEYVAVVMIRTTHYGGMTNMGAVVVLGDTIPWAQVYIPTSPTSANLDTPMRGQDIFAGVFHHETIGHALAKLADEYYYISRGAASDEVKSQIRESQDALGFYLNVSTTWWPTATPWYYLYQDYRLTEDIGAYEGAYTYAFGVYRPVFDHRSSIMNDSYLYNTTGTFNVSSRAQIYKTVMRLAYGSTWKFDYDAFLDFDAPNRSSSAKAKASTGGVGEPLGASTMQLPSPRISIIR